MWLQQSGQLRMNREGEQGGTGQIEQCQLYDLGLILSAMAAPGGAKAGEGHGLM